MASCGLNVTPPRCVRCGHAEVEQIKFAPGSGTTQCAEIPYDFGAAQSLRLPIAGCVDTNTRDFDGSPYQDGWPNGDTARGHAGVVSAAPTTGAGLDQP